MGQVPLTGANQTGKGPKAVTAATATFESPGPTALTEEAAGSAALVDTDVLIDHLRGHRRLAPGGARLAYSVITRCDLFAGNTGQEQVRDILDVMIEVPVAGSVAESAGLIRRRHGTPLADALIAATALELKVPLLTRNLRHYRGIAGLKVQAPS